MRVMRVCDVNSPKYVDRALLNRFLLGLALSYISFLPAEDVPLAVA